MYRPTQFREDRPDVLAAAIQELRLATLVTISGGEIVASHIPMILKTDSGVQRLEGHVARGNKQWEEVQPALDALAIFLGPHAYVSPAWYASKLEHQKVVPTWNYIAIHAAGPLSVVHDKEWLLRHLNDLTDLNEAGRNEPWSVSDAPPEFIESLCSGIVGFSMDVRKLEGAWKMAQHRSEADRLGVIEGLKQSETAGDDRVASEMTRLEERRAEVCGRTSPAATGSSQPDK